MFTIDAHFFSISEWCMLISRHILKGVSGANIGMVCLNETPGLCKIYYLGTMSNGKKCTVTGYGEGVGDNNADCGEGV